jgi:hypothetical protein
MDLPPGPDRIGFLTVPETTPESQRIFEDDVADIGYVMNTSRLWAYQPATAAGLFDLLRQATSTESLSLRQRFILVAACASALGDSYCSLVWPTGWPRPPSAEGGPGPCAASTLA